ncbi:arginine--tRNA ligase [Candidatus Micrarchaeota archaeon]|nr:arginine--tRNA ligase [Candidatus Micrarchaeota archaeon]
MFFLIKDEISKSLAHLTNLPKEEILKTLEPSKFCHLTSKIAFLMKGKPPENSQKLADSFPKHKYIKRAEAKGPYLNFFFSESFFSEFLSSPKISFPKTNHDVIVEYPSVNPNKPWHVGHLRNALLGDSVARILSFTGCSVLRMDYIDDLGLQVAQSIWGFENLPKNKPPKKFDHFLGEQYVQVSSKLEEIKEEVVSILHELESGTPKAKKWRKDIVEPCLKAQYQTSFSYNVYHDFLIFESDIMKEVFQKGIELIKSKKGIVFEKEGKNKDCWVVKLSEEFKGMKDADKILIRSNGTATYTGKDLIFQLWKFGEFQEFNYKEFLSQPDSTKAYMSSEKGEKKQAHGADIIINVIGREQEYPQLVIKKVFEKIGMKERAENYKHLSYAPARLPESSFSGRKGTWKGYTADELLEESYKREMQKIGEISNKKENAEKIALSAIRYSFLKIDADKIITFNWDEALALEGNSAPYILYTYVRAKKILEKIQPPELLEFSLNSEEENLLLHLLKFKEIIRKTSKDLRPNYLADFLYEAAVFFNKFYSTSRVIDNGELVPHRACIVKKYFEYCSLSLSLLGLSPPEEM